jgi:hypothetical protein
MFRWAAGMTLQLHGVRTLMACGTGMKFNASLGAPISWPWSVRCGISDLVVATSPATGAV